MKKIHSAEAARIISRTNEIAKHHGAKRIENIHLFYGLLCAINEDSALRDIFKKSGINAEEMLSEISQKLITTMDPIPFSPEFKKTLDTAVELGQGQAQPQHLLLALLQNSDKNEEDAK